MSDERQNPLISLTANSLDGGIGRNLINLSNSFIKLGCRVELLTETSSNYYKNAIHPSVSLYNLKTTHPVSGIVQLAKHLITRRPAVILTPILRHTILTIRARRITCIPFKIFTNIHNTYSKAYWGLPEKKFSSRIRKFRKYYTRCDGRIAVSRGVAEDFSNLTSIPISSIRTIYNPIVSEELLQQAAEPINHPWFSNGEPPLILSVGRLEPQKNFPLLIEAFEILRGGGTSCRLMILGDGSLKTVLEKRIQSSPFKTDICLYGHCDNPFSFMKHSSIMVLSSSWEGFGNVLVEAMAVGTPVLSTDCPHGPREILEDGKLGALVPPGDPVALARATLHNLQNPVPSETLKTASARFEAGTVARAYLKAFGITCADDH